MILISRVSVLDRESVRLSLDGNCLQVMGYDDDRPPSRMNYRLALPDLVDTMRRRWLDTGDRAPVESKTTDDTR